MNIWKGLNHKVPLRTGRAKNQDAIKRPEGMSGRQWKRAYKNARRFLKSAPVQPLSLAK